jgi:vacuolar-type H+-ATPase subunit E/Vma4
MTNEPEKRRTIAEVLAEKRKLFTEVDDATLERYAKAYREKIEELESDLRFCEICAQMVIDEHERRVFNEAHSGQPCL